MSNSPPESICRFAPRARGTYQPRKRTRYIYFRHTHADKQQLLLRFHQLPLGLQITHRVSPARPATFHTRIRQACLPKRCAPGAWLMERKEIGRYGSFRTPTMSDVHSRLQEMINLMKMRN